MAVPRLTDEEIIFLRDEIALKKAIVILDGKSRSKWSAIKLWLGVFTAAATALTVVYHWVVEFFKPPINQVVSEAIKQGLQK
jgi:hypothetical protein